MILSPTRELAEQTNAVALSLGGPMGLKTHLCIGGTRVTDDIYALRRGVHMVIGTPGRLLDLLRGRNGRTAPLNASRLKSWIVDEVLYHNISYRIIPYLTIPYLTIPYLSLQCRRTRCFEKSSS